MEKQNGVQGYHSIRGKRPFFSSTVIHRYLPLSAICILAIDNAFLCNEVVFYFLCTTFNQMITWMGAAGPGVSTTTGILILLRLLTLLFKRFLHYTFACNQDKSVRSCTASLPPFGKNALAIVQFWPWPPVYCSYFGLLFPPFLFVVRWSPEPSTRVYHQKTSVRGERQFQERQILIEGARKKNIWNA